MSKVELKSQAQSLYLEALAVSPATGTIPSLRNSSFFYLELAAARSKAMKWEEKDTQPARHFHLAPQSILTNSLRELYEFQLLKFLNKCQDVSKIWIFKVSFWVQLLFLLKSSIVLPSQLSPNCPFTANVLASLARIKNQTGTSAVFCCCHYQPNPQTTPKKCYTLPFLLLERKVTSFPLLLIPSMLLTALSISPLSPYLFNNSSFYLILSHKNLIMINFWYPKRGKKENLKLYFILCLWSYPTIIILSLWK